MKARARRGPFRPSAALLAVFCRKCTLEFFEISAVSNRRPAAASAIVLNPSALRLSPDAAAGGIRAAAPKVRPFFLIIDSPRCFATYSRSPWPESQCVWRTIAYDDVVKRCGGEIPWCEMTLAYDNGGFCAS